MSSSPLSPAHIYAEAGDASARARGSTCLNARDLSLLDFARNDAASAAYDDDDGGIEKGKIFQFQILNAFFRRGMSAAVTALVSGVCGCYYVSPQLFYNIYTQTHTHTL